ncbi:MAG TPA: signal peptide peptidase SppA [Vicinamibacterales bacterium]|nr:signal peptide peptidase SppA [Vicinamibacterales bacterium]
MTTRRGVGFVFALIGLAILVSAAGLVVLYVSVSGGGGFARTARGTSSSSALVLRPEGELPELRPDDVFDQFVDRGTDSLRAFLSALRRAKTDPRITSVVLMPGSLDSPYWARVQELRDAIVDFRQSGKPVTAFLEYGGDREYYLASAADKIYLLPSSSLDLTGIAAYEIFLRGAFDKLGAYPDFIHIGDYKTATNQLTEKAMTPAHREMSESLNKDMFAQLVRAIAEGRNKSEAEVRALIDAGPFLPKAALDAGLVDGIAYQDELDDLVPVLRRGAGRVNWLESDEYGANGDGVRLRRRPRIAVLYAVGTIVSGRSGFDPTDGGLVGSDTLIEDIRRIRDDGSIRGIVLRIDSPGGSSVASDVILRELQLTKKDDPDRPIVVSMSDLAASGGYYIALAGDEIVAQPGTLTGSIGIYTGKIVYGGTLEKVGVSAEAVTSGANADIYSPLSPFSPAQRLKVEAFMRDFYTGFLDKTAASRHKTREEVHALAQGRVWTGAQAKENGLVDRLGGLDEAIAALKERAEIGADEAVEVVVYPRRRTFYEALSDSFGRSGAGVNVVRALTGAHGPGRAIASATAPGRLFRRGEPLALMPFAFVR